MAVHVNWYVGGVVGSFVIRLLGSPTSTASSKFTRMNEIPKVPAIDRASLGGLPEVLSLWSNRTICPAWDAIVSVGETAGPATAGAATAPPAPRLGAVFFGAAFGVAAFGEITSPQVGQTILRVIELAVPFRDAFAAEGAAFFGAAFFISALL